MFAGGNPATTAVAADDAVDEPTAFDAVTDETTLEPTSAAVKVYVDPVAEAMAKQFAPFVSQRNHRYAKVDGLFVQVPFVVESV